MPIYGVKVRGDGAERIVRASSAAKALNAEELADAIGRGAEIETATETESDPAPTPPGDPPASDEKPETEPAAKAK